MTRSLLPCAPLALPLAALDETPGRQDVPDDRSAEAGGPSSLDT